MNINAVSKQTTGELEFIVLVKAWRNLVRFNYFTVGSLILLFSVDLHYMIVHCGLLLFLQFTLLTCSCYISVLLLLITTSHSLPNTGSDYDF